MYAFHYAANTPRYGRLSSEFPGHLHKHFKEEFIGLRILTFSMVLHLPLQAYRMGRCLVRGDILGLLRLFQTALLAPSTALTSSSLSLTAMGGMLNPGPPSLVAYYAIILCLLCCLGPSLFFYISIYLLNMDARVFCSIEHAAYGLITAGALSALSSTRLTMDGVASYYTLPFPAIELPHTWSPSLPWRRNNAQVGCEMPRQGFGISMHA